MKFNPSTMFSVFENGRSKFNTSSDSLQWSKATKSSLEQYEQQPTDLDYYLRAAWKMLSLFPQDKIYNQDLMRSAIEFIGMKISAGENLKVTRIKFAKIYGELNLFYLEIASEGVATFPRSYTHIVKNKKSKKKIIKKASTVKLKKQKWNEEILMGTINTEELPNTTISLCKSDDEKSIVIAKGKPITEIFTIPLKSAQSIIVTVESAITQAKKLGWL
ncbi:MAG: hypothetical protein DBY32_01350 [Phascolarctobacterium sp.]|nr:MAG: hypothetical protein DBY32_01350 [Phascolarctobacterium sp.]